uniref:Fibrinogen C-terminal domain-containing protein n=1 Tax=Anopheles albimanus TaxID=7167 RepID=A0A182F1U1_ANOAL
MLIIHHYLIKIIIIIIIINRINHPPPRSVYCTEKTRESLEYSSETQGGGWMVVQHRFDGSLSFDRTWTEYRNGFGAVDGEHWLGLERIFQFTKEHECELLVEMKDFYNNSNYARYDSFGIGSEAEHYKLATLGTHNGTAGDSLTSHKGMKFSTSDRDNDNSANGNCAMDWDGGWWFNSCGNVYLNGLYRNVSGNEEDNISWYHFNDDWRGLSYTRMLLRPLN